MGSKDSDRQDAALAGALAYLKSAPPDDRLYEAAFGTYTDGTGCWWQMRLVTEITNGKVAVSPESWEQKVLTLLAAWREAYQETGETQ